jgi:hypothetical protein
VRSSVPICHLTSGGAAAAPPRSQPLVQLQPPPDMVGMCPEATVWHDHSVPSSQYRLDYLAVHLHVEELTAVRFMTAGMYMATHNTHGNTLHRVVVLCLCHPTEHTNTLLDS